MADSFVGSNAAFTKTDQVHYIRHNPFVVYWVIGVVCVAILSAFVHWACIGLVLLAGLGLVAAFLWRMDDMHAKGTTNPAIVTCLEPFTVAVLAEMTLTQGKSFPGVQFATVPDPYGGRARVGMKLPVVCNYHLGPEGFAGEHWGSVSPTPIAVLTPDPEAVEHAARMISPAEWVVLENAIKTIPDLRTPRMYLLQASPMADRKSEEFTELFKRYVPNWR